MFRCKRQGITHWKHAEGMSLRYDVIAPSPIVVDINHRICQSKGDWVLFALSDNLITEDWFFAEGERFFIH